jgi:FlaA1/EpsC-like NDP-sugar epimerase
VLNFLYRLYKKPMLIIIDLLLINLALGISFYLRFDTSWLYYFDVKYHLIISVIGFVLLYISNLYNKIWRYASIAELYSIIKISILLNVFFVLYNFFLQLSFPRSILIINGLLDIFFLGGLRFFLRFLKEYVSKVRDSEGKLSLNYRRRGCS